MLRVPAETSTPPPRAPARAQANSRRETILIAGNGKTEGASSAAVFIGLSQVCRLDDIAGEEQLNEPIRQDTNPAFRSRQLHKINSAPQQPREQAAETNGSPARERNHQFSAGRMMADDAQCAQRSEVKSFRGAALQSGANIASQHAGFAQSELSRGRAGASPSWHL